MKNQKNIIIAIIALVLSSIMFLSILEHKQHTGKDSQGWWSVYFVAPYDEQSLDFIIESYDKKTKFSYEVILDDEVVKSEEVTVETGEENIKLIDLDIEKEETKSAEIKVNLSGENGSKSIFKR